MLTLREAHIRSRQLIARVPEWPSYIVTRDRETWRAYCRVAGRLCQGTATDEEGEGEAVRRLMVDLHQYGERGL